MIEVEKQGLRSAKQSDGEVSIQEFPGNTRLTSRRSFAAMSAEMAVTALELERRSVAFSKQEEVRSKQRRSCQMRPVL